MDSLYNSGYYLKGNLARGFSKSFRDTLFGKAYRQVKLLG